MSERKYYDAYNDRYQQVHGLNLRWFAEKPSPIVAETMQKYSISREHRLLEIGCGEGRDARPLLEQGYDLLATDVSAEAISYCKNAMPDHAEHFRVLDCVAGTLEESFDFIYAVAVVHMLVPDVDRNAFYTFIREHLNPGGIALICTMGDGSQERQSDIRTAFDLQDRIHEPTGKSVRIACTSCRMVSTQTFGKELERNGLKAVRQGMTSIEPDFTQMMYAVVKAD